jgi:hypothetical protein
LVPVSGKFQGRGDAGDPGSHDGDIHGV